MIALHDTWHGSGYWREMLLATIAETIRYPDFMASDVASVNVPIMAVQGTNDSVNVPGRHAETIAEWFPQASLWLADGFGHSVHQEAPAEFVERVSAFFARCPA
jgi:pimeloyl-ACP methyl ester carboxylesterase